MYTNEAFRFYFLFLILLGEKVSTGSTQKKNGNGGRNSDKVSMFVVLPDSYFINFIIVWKL